MQVYDNRRAVDYLLTREEVNGKVGVTGVLNRLIGLANIIGAFAAGVLLDP